MIGAMIWPLDWFGIIELVSLLTVTVKVAARGHT